MGERRVYHGTRPDGSSYEIVSWSGHRRYRVFRVAHSSDFGPQIHREISDPNVEMSDAARAIDDMILYDREMTIGFHDAVAATAWCVDQIHQRPKITAFIVLDQHTSDHWHIEKSDDGRVTVESREGESWSNEPDWTPEG